MDLDEIFDGRRTGRNHSRDHLADDNHRYANHFKYGPGTHSNKTHGKDSQWVYLAQQISRNPKLRLLAVVSAILLLFLIIIIALLVYPFLIRLVDILDQKGIQGVAEFILGALRQIVSGSGK